MSQVVMPTDVVGNEFVIPERSVRVVAAPAAVVEAPVVVTTPAYRERTFEVPETYLLKPSLWNRMADLAASHRVIVIALLFLIVSSGATIAASQIISARISPVAATASRTKHIISTAATGPNAVISNRELTKRLSAITDQRIAINIGGQTALLKASTTKTWLNVVTDKQAGVSYVHVDGQAVADSLTSLAKANTIDAVNEVKVTEPGGASVVIAAGKNGSQPADTSLIAKQITKTFLAGRGMQLELPVKTVNYASVAPTSIAKLLEVNVDTKQMYAFDHGKLVQSFAISAGAPTTPTPIGQYKIYQKLAVQDMRGYNTNGTRYFQPHVHWINYFLPGGFAVHGVYWHPLSWFGNINSSHGCVGLPEDEAKWVYDWAPLGTTVITHHDLAGWTAPSLPDTTSTPTTPTPTTQSQ